MDQLDVQTDNKDPLKSLSHEQLLELFRCNKKKMSPMDHPHNFLNQLCVHELIPEEVHQKTSVSFSFVTSITRLTSSGTSTHFDFLIAYSWHIFLRDKGLTCQINSLIIKQTHRLRCEDTGSTKLGSFRSVHPKALGTVQIMVGLVILLIGIVMASSPRLDNVGVVSGIFVWGSIIYVIAGSLTVAADNHLNKCLVKGSLGMNVVVTVMSFVGIILYSLDTAGVMLRFTCRERYDSSGQGYYYGVLSAECQAYWTRSSGISGVMLVLSLLEFIASICVSSFGCKAVCQCCSCCPCCYTPEQIFVVEEQMLVPQVNSGIPNPGYGLPSHETVNYPKEPERGSTDTGFLQYNPPPQYTAVLP
ncbi:hypothetical protein DPEC_G00275110 [Dallia pectoralis]|uniref:Uncharacterized protein n=1 Tax=Dallia pectoralis TaxID=75939 RepID=A0ACC2FL51_DALPE|nr:hypothetical protein DPEC_G00275110 [Dallia pectoralis]